MAESRASRIVRPSSMVVLKTVDQSPAYPMQLMLGIYEFPPEEGRETGTSGYPKPFVVDYVRGYRPAV